MFWRSNNDLLTANTENISHHYILGHLDFGVLFEKLCCLKVYLKLEQVYTESRAL